MSFLRLAIFSGLLSLRCSLLRAGLFAFLLLLGLSMSKCSVAALLKVVVKLVHSSLMSDPSSSSPRACLTVCFCDRFAVLYYSWFFFSVA